MCSIYYQHQQARAHSVNVMLFGDKNFCDNNYLLNVKYLLVFNELSNKEQYFSSKRAFIIYYY